MRLIDVFPPRFLTYDLEDEVAFDQGLTVLVGPNGAGKTAIGLEAVAWCLWGKTARGTVPDGDVAVTFEVGAETFSVRRSRKGKKAGLLSLCRGDLDLSGQTTAETQVKICDLVGTWERFCAERVFSNRLRARFGSATDKERKALLEAVLGLERHERAAKQARLVLAARKTVLEGDRTTLAAAQASATEARRALGAIPAGTGEGVEALREAAEMQRDKVALLEQRARELTAVAKEAQARAATLQRTEDEVSRSFKQALLRHGEVVGKLEDTERRARAAETMGDCPVCRTPAAAIPRDKLAAHWEELLAPLRQEKASLDALMPPLREELLEIQADTLRFAEQYRIADDNATAAERAARDVARDTRLALALAVEERRSELVAAAEARVRETAAAEETARLNEEASELACVVAELACDALGSRGARVARMDSALQDLTLEAGRVLAQLPMDDGMLLTMAISGSRELAKGGSVDEVKIEVGGAGGGEYDGTSDGERARLDVALMLAMSRVSGGDGLLVFDEIFDPLDGAALEAVAELLTELAAIRQVVVITHNPRFLDLIPAASKWVVERRGGKSRVGRAA